MASGEADMTADLAVYTNKRSEVYRRNDRTGALEDTSQLTASTRPVISAPHPLGLWSVDTTEDVVFHVNARHSCSSESPRQITG